MVTSSSKKTKITVAHGDGIGPEIMAATLKILGAAGARLDIDTIEIGEQVYNKGITTGIDDKDKETLRKNKILLKAPITTPQGGGYKSLNVTIRKEFGLFANVRPCVSYAPYVKSMHSKMDMVIVRENEEDLYGGIEHQHTQDVAQNLKLISYQGCERIIRYAFEYARRNGRKKVTCMSKDNIMKQTDGMFHKLFEEIAKEYPDIENEHYIIDIGSARIASRPQSFDVVVTLNLYGDIISDIAAEVTGSVGLCGSANIGEDFAMFEAIHGSAPDISGQGIANPSGLLLGAVMMLNHVGQNDVAEKVHNAWLKTIEDGVHTGEIYNQDNSTKRVNTEEFTDAVIARLGQEPQHLPKVDYTSGGKGGAMPIPKLGAVPSQAKTLVGMDVFFDWPAKDGVDALVQKLTPLLDNDVEIAVVSNRGTKVWPDGNPGIFCTDLYAVRLSGKNGKVLTHKQLADQLEAFANAGLDFVQTSNLYNFGKNRGFSLAQGQ